MLKLNRFLAVAIAAVVLTPAARAADYVVVNKTTTPGAPAAGYVVVNKTTPAVVAEALSPVVPVVSYSLPGSFGGECANGNCPAPQQTTRRGFFRR